jgi:hypothetical protein
MQAVSDTAIAIIVIIIGILILGLLTKVNENKKKLDSKEFMNNAILENNLALYLKQPVEVDGSKLTMADLIVLTAETGDSEYEKLWTRLSYAYFAKLGFNMERLRVFVNKPNCNFNCAIFGGKLSGEIAIGATPHISLPKFDSTIYLPSYSRLLLINIVYSPT